MKVFSILICVFMVSTYAEDRLGKLINKYCVDCHGGKKTKGDVNLKDYDGIAHIYKKYEIWEDAITQVEEGEMPPEDEAQMSKEDKAFFLTKLKDIFDNAEKVELGDPGPSPLRRLTRREYNNTIRDIFNVDLGLGKEFPSEGGGGEGFDNNAEVLNFSPLMFEKYVQEAKKLSEHLTFNYATGFEIFKEEVPLRNRPQRLVEIRKQIDEIKNSAMPPRFQVEDYLRQYVKASWELLINGKKDDDQIWEYARSKKMNPVFIKKMVHYFGDQNNKNEVEKKYYAKLFALKKDSTSKEIDEATKQVLEGYKKARYINEHSTPEPKELYRHLIGKVRGCMRMNGKEVKQAISEAERVRLELMEKERWLIEGQLDTRTRHLSKVFKKFDDKKKKEAWADPLKFLNKKDQGSYRWFTKKHEEIQVEKSKLLTARLSELLSNAYRRAPQEDEVAKLKKLFESEAEKKGVQHAARLVLIRVFCSPAFVFRVEKQKNINENYKISDNELAVRLSYFLWSSMPDQELLNLAAQNKLSDSKVLNQQIDRMLKNPKSRALAEDFAAQWLKFRDVLERVELDKKRFPEFNEELAHDMFQECTETFNYIVQSDSSVMELLDNKYLFVNDRLAKIYNLKGVKGNNFRKVDISDTRRGGLVTSSAMMTMTSYPLRTSPVLRGNYIISALLGIPTPPPPEGVEELPEDDSVADGLTVKQRFEQHRKDPVCFSCHIRMDPMGFPLEVFDPLGRLREKSGGHPIDANGEMKDGRVLAGPSGLKKYLLEQEDLFLKNMASKLLGYSLGRSLEFFDRYTVAKAVRDTKKEGYKFSAMVKSIVNSKLFQYRRGVKK
ncbi:MAG: DUF1592 domain-containing protein [Lentisphaeraceae bacterium]|nr:DUF1592 domain-containing protein [Lentisphaeraceae bacterium]